MKQSTGTCINKFSANIRSVLLKKYNEVEIKYRNIFLEEIKKSANIGKFETHININTADFTIFKKLTTNLENWNNVETLINTIAQKWIKKEDATLYELEYKTYKIDEELFIQFNIPLYADGLFGTTIVNLILIAKTYNEFNSLMENYASIKRLYANCIIDELTVNSEMGISTSSIIVDLINFIGFGFEKLDMNKKIGNNDTESIIINIINHIIEEN